MAVSGKSINIVIYLRAFTVVRVKQMPQFHHVVKRVSAIMKAMSVTTLAGSMAYKQSQVLSDHVLFTGKPGISVDFEDPSIPLEYYEFPTPEICGSSSNRHS
jgi:hypothetical protein